jgi:hypothetical protein
MVNIGIWFAFVEVILFGLFFAKSRSSSPSFFVR